LESRRYARYQVTAKAFFSWKEQRIRRTGEGMTRDMSAAGMFVSTAFRPQAATRVRVEVVLPPLQEGGSPVWVKVFGQVVRIESDRAETAGFALTSQNFVLRNGASEARPHGANSAESTPSSSTSSPKMETS
jgi:hypothetical protein